MANPRKITKVKCASCGEVWNERRYVKGYATCSNCKSSLTEYAEDRDQLTEYKMTDNGMVRVA